PDARPADVAACREAIGGRPVWLAASTHEGEEVAVAAAHRIIKARFPDLLTIIVPRHPHRGPAIHAMLEEGGLAVSRRSLGGTIDAAVEVYLADTLGELGLFYRVAPVAFLGGSLVPRGGQNPIEPVYLDAAILHGPRVHNFADIYDVLDRAGQAEPVADAEALANAVAALIADPATARLRASGAAATLRSFGGALDETMRGLAPFLDGAAARTEAP
ncbi:MAG: 3-deoxy-D-manno-octulosonic acid transferase, partial [Bauldia sp.]